MPVTDVLIIGSGIAGLSFAAKIAERFPDRQVTMLTKNAHEESNTRYAQGGIAVVSDSRHDSFQKHIDDTLRAGDGLCDEEVVAFVVREGPAQLEELVQRGAAFDHDESGALSLCREGGHTAHRIIHYKDITGFHISQSLLRYLGKLSNVTLLQHHMAVDLVTEENRCLGVHAINLATGALEEFAARVTLLATGGAGQVYNVTTNPAIATGDGIAMASRAGAAIRDMEFIQFHPTAFYSETDNPSFLISEAVRGFGAHLCTQDGERFMFKYDDRGELASRDIVSRAICQELRTRGDHAVYLDCRHLPAAELMAHFPTIYSTCLLKGIDITKDPVPVAPAAHYVCGGIAVDRHGRTSVQYLYACGECTRTGLHGANRLASNSLLEALVYAHHCFTDIAPLLNEIPLPQANHVSAYACTTTADDALWVSETQKALRLLMSQHVSIVCSHQLLRDALNTLNAWHEEVMRRIAQIPLSPAMCELRNLLTVARIITQQSLARRENRGTFFNIDLV